MRKVYDIISIEIVNKNNIDNIKAIIQNNNVLDVGTKEVGIDFLNFYSKRNIVTSQELDKSKYRLL